MKKQSLIKGTVILGVATIFARFLGLFFRIPIQNLIGDQGMGYYQMSYPIYMTFVALASGIPMAMSKLIAEYEAKNDLYSVNLVFKRTLKIMIPLGIITSLLMFGTGKTLVRLLRWHEKSYYSYMVISSGPIFVCLMCTFKGYFQGLQNMNSTAVCQVIEQIGRVVFGVAMAYLLIPHGVEFAAAGAAFGTVAGGILGSVYLCLKYIRAGRRKIRKPLKIEHGIMRKLIEAALPISVGAAVGTIMSLIDSIIVPQRLVYAGFTLEECAKMYGQFTGKAMTIQNIPLALSMALCASLVPIISEAYSMHRNDELDKRIQMVFKLSFLIGIPSGLGLFFLACPVMGLVFMGDFGGHSILKVLALSVPFIIITQTTTSVLQSCGRYMKPIYNLMAGCIIKIIVTYVMVAMPAFNIYGAVAGSILGYMVTSILNIREVRGMFKVSINYYEVLIKPLIVSLIMIICVVFIYNNVYNYTISNGVSCMIAIFAGMILFGILTILFKVITLEDIRGRITRN